MRLSVFAFSFEYFCVINASIVPIGIHPVIFFYVVVGLCKGESLPNLVTFSFCGNLKHSFIDDAQFSTSRLGSLLTR